EFTHPCTHTHTHTPTHIHTHTHTHSVQDNMYCNVTLCQQVAANIHQVTLGSGRAVALAANLTACSLFLSHSLYHTPRDTYSLSLIFSLIFSITQTDTHSLSLIFSLFLPPFLSLTHSLSLALSHYYSFSHWLPQLCRQFSFPISFSLSPPISPLPPFLSHPSPSVP